MTKNGCWNLSQICRKSRLRRSCVFEAPQGAQGERRKPKLGTFGRHLGDLGRHYGTSWVQWEIPKSLILTSSRKHIWKKWPTMERHKKQCFLMRSWLKNARFGKGWTLPNALYISIWVVFDVYWEIANIKESWRWNAPQSDPKIDLLAPTISIFWGLGRLFQVSDL